jgi:tripartite-type tricarboxylate transporter receptor subunit TctC
MRRHLAPYLISLLIANGFASSSYADPVEDFYKIHPVTLLVGYTSGGGFDLYARTLANHLGKYIPGHPSVVVQNMSGAGSLKAANYIYNVAPKDGSIFGLVRAPVMEPLVGSNGAQFETTKFTWIGSGANDVTICGLMGNPKVKTMADGKTYSFTVAGSGPGSDEDMFARILNKLFDLKIQLVTGYPGGAEMLLAVERGEVDGRCGWAYSSVKMSKPDWIASHKLKVLTTLAMTRSPDLPDTPAVMEFATTEWQKQILTFVLSCQTLGRPFVAPPNVPADRAAALRAAFDKTMKDKDFIAEMTSRKLEVNPVNAKDVEALLKTIYATPPKVIEETRAIIAGN